MNRSLLTIYIVLIVAFFNQFSFGMECSRERSLVITCFSESSPEVQDMIMKHSDNFSNIQQTNWHWSERKSIKSPHIFITDVCSIDNDRLLRILLNATYHKNYQGVENILKNSRILASAADRFPYYHIGTNRFNATKKVLDLHTIAQCNEDDKMSALLNVYNVRVAPLDENIIPHNLTPLSRACFLGNSQSIEPHLNVTTKEMKNAFKIAVDCDRGRCIKVLLDHLYFDSNVTDMIVNFKQIKCLLERSLLEYACSGKRINALKALLATDHFDLNKIENDQTILDETLQKAQNDSEYDAVVLLLQQYGAKTVDELDIEAQDMEDACGKLTFPCTIF